MQDSGALEGLIFSPSGQANSETAPSNMVTATHLASLSFWTLSVWAPKFRTAQVMGSIVWRL